MEEHTIYSLQVNGDIYGFYDTPEGAEDAREEMQESDDYIYQSQDTELSIKIYEHTIFINTQDQKLVD